MGKTTDKVWRGANSGKKLTADDADCMRNESSASSDMQTAGAKVLQQQLDSHAQQL